MKFREGLLTGQEGGSPCQDINVFIFYTARSSQSSVFPYSENQKNRLITSQL